MLDDPNSRTPVSPAPEVAQTTPSAAQQKFRSCRWRHAAEDNGGPEWCTHRDVQPLAGTTGFDAEAWCPDCTFFKLRRTPRKRPPTDYGY